ncbi:hypothetical protein N7517_008895 [Penicillium concentricum]|uniref:Oxidoreductase acuF-like C2H2 type zinc-finger domain-containing protein n=1 Tax=Penicillium concentricum TaxID=293559 RepID=A0A9W9V363_9EURO|nr:uncharacterized protein N7517_008895 [Penicillium concentricum]KAJ5366009.1 hypothetical protein N7517_008895 [Penicillium concentricum]
MHLGISQVTAPPAQAEIDPEDENLTMPPEPPVNDVYKEAHQSDDILSEDGASETSYNGTLSEGIDGSTKIPLMPQEGRGKTPFKCPYCFFSITVRDDRAWAQHILRDLIWLPTVVLPRSASTSNHRYFFSMHDLQPEDLLSVEFQQHVAGHLQELALFYLSRVAPEKDKDLEMRQEEGGQNVNAEQRLNSFDAEKKNTEERTKAKLKKGKSKVSPEMEEDEDNLVRDIAEEVTRNLYGVVENLEKQTVPKEATIEEWKLVQERTKQKKREIREQLRNIGYSNEEIEKFTNKKMREQMESTKKEAKEKRTKSMWRTRVHRKDLLPDTVIAYNLPWDWDENNKQYIIIKQLVSRELLQELFSHTRSIREGKVVVQTSKSMTELKAHDGDAYKKHPRKEIVNTS